MSIPTISIICVTYKQNTALKVFVNSILNQTQGNWQLTVVHDGPCLEFDLLLKDFLSEGETRISHFNTPIRFNDYGHSLREQAIGKITGDYVLITNGDNYYVPILIEALTKKITDTDPDVVMFDMIHSHHHPGGRPLRSYSFFRTQYQRQDIDIGAAAVRTSLARKAGFRDKTFEGDATYFEDVARACDGPLKIAKIPQVLFVHN